MTHIETENQPERRGRRRLVRFAAPLVAGVAIGAGAVAGADSLHGAPATTTATSGGAPVTAPIAQTATQYDARTIYGKTSPGVVDLTVTISGSGSDGGGLSPFGPSQGGGTAEGTGFVYDRSGNIITAEHVVEGASAITVRFSDGTTAKATIVGKDPSTDIAVIKVDVPASKLTPLPLGASTDVVPGEGVVAIGSPFGYEESITAGIVSAVDRDIQAPNGYSIPNTIQTDAAINHGNSGGPLIDANARVIGVNVQIAADGSSGTSQNAGVGFAVPSDTVRTVADDIIAGRAVQHAYLGVSIGDNGSAPGAKVGTVRAGGPAAAAGLQSGDVVVGFDGKTISGANQLTAAIAAHSPGDKVTMKVTRGGSTITVQVTLGNRPASTTA